MKIVYSTIGLFLFICTLFWFAIGDEIYYYKNSNYSTYIIEIELLTGSIDTIKVNQPDDIHFQINCHSNKGNFRGCNLEYLMPRKGFNLGGHWCRQRDGVINYRILSKNSINK